MSSQGPPPMLERRTNSTLDDSMHSNYGYASSSKQGSPTKVPGQQPQAQPNAQRPEVKRPQP